MSEAVLVTEAVFEEEAVKAAVLRRLAEVCRPDCLIATNTSTIPISTLAAALPAERRARFLGTHYCTDEQVLSDGFLLHCANAFRALHPFDSFLNRSTD
jgi:3-hydroxyacyl-CoA dehydrogenase